MRDLQPANHRKKDWSRTSIRYMRSGSPARLYKESKARGLDGGSHPVRRCGYSGGSIETPSPQKLLADIQSRAVDVVVVYKVDRLTRSLADFAKIVEIF